MSLQPGTFRVRGGSAALGFTSGQKEQVAVLLEILDEGYVGETITWFGFFTEATTERTLDSLRLLGWKGDDLFDLSGIGETEARAVLDEEDYNGEMRLKVKWINGPGGLALKAPMNESQARAFAARMKGTVLAHKQTAGQPAALKPRAAVPASRQAPPQRRQHHDAPPPHEDDDQIPF